MTKRKYSVGEIDQKRANLQYICRGDNAAAEDQLRTYMLNGTETIELAHLCAENMQARFKVMTERSRRSYGQGTAGALFNLP